MAQKRGKQKNKKSRRPQTAKRVRRPEDRHYPSFWEKSAQQLVAIALVLGLLTWGYQMDFRLFATAVRPGVSLRRILDWQAWGSTLRQADAGGYFQLFVGTLLLATLLFVLVLVVNFWVQWTWHELKPLLGMVPPSKQAKSDHGTGDA